MMDSRNVSRLYKKYGSRRSARRVGPKLARVATKRRRAKGKELLRKDAEHC